MEKKRYETPELKELGSFTSLTKNSVIGENYDSQWSDGFPEVFGS